MTDNALPLATVPQTGELKIQTSLYLPTVTVITVLVSLSGAVLIISASRHHILQKIRISVRLTPPVFQRTATIITWLSGRIIRQIRWFISCLTGILISVRKLMSVPFPMRQKSNYSLTANLLVHRRLTTKGHSLSLRLADCL